MMFSIIIYIENPSKKQYDTAICNIDMSVLYMLSSRFTRTRSRFSLVDIRVRRRGYGNFSRKPSHAAKMYEACRPIRQKLFVTRNSGWNPRERDDRERRS